MSTDGETKPTHNLSERGWANVEAIMPKIKGAVSERMSNATSNIDLSTAENWLIRPELVELCRIAITEKVGPRQLSYPRGFSGDPELLDAFCGLLNTYFAPHEPVLPSHLATAPGAMAAIDTLLFNICEAGDGVIIPGPYWNGFDFGVSVRAAVKPVLATVPSLASVLDEKALIQSLEDACETAECNVKALMLTNPHNPLSLCYSRSLLEACVQFCERRKIHFVCDEVYALSVFQSPDLPDAQPFVSVLSLDLGNLGVNPSRVHAVWSMSKDFGQSGVRMGLSVSQSNQAMAVACALAAQMQISTLTSTFVTALLTAPDLDSLVRLNAARLAKAYVTITSFFNELSIPYIPCNAGLYVFAKLAPKAKTWEDEGAVTTKLKEAGVLVSCGQAYHGPEGERGWARVGFAVEPKELDEAIARMRIVFAAPRANLTKETTNSIRVDVSTRARTKRRRGLINDKTVRGKPESGKTTKMC